MSYGLWLITLWALAQMGMGFESEPIAKSYQQDYQQGRPSVGFDSEPYGLWVMKVWALTQNTVGFDSRVLL